MGIYSWYEHRSRWHKLRSLGTSSVVRLAILMPVVGYLLLLNDKIIAFADIDPRFKIYGHDDPWRLMLFFYGTVFLSAASLLFSTFCPGASKKYDTAVEYTLSEQHFWRVHLSELRLTLSRDMKQLNSAHRSYLNEKKIAENLFLDEATLGLDAITVLLMTYKWNYLDGRSTWSRISARICYDLGFALLSIPTSVTLYGVTRFLVELSARHARSLGLM